MSLAAYLSILRRRWTWVVAGVLLGVLAAGVSSALTAPSYRATASLFVSLQAGSSANELAQGATYTQDQISSYVILATSPVVLQPVIEELGLDVTPRALAGQLSAEVEGSTVVLNITATSPSPDDAALLANAVADQLSEAVEGLAPPNEQGDPTVQVATIAPAVPPSFPASPRTTLEVAVGLLVGLVLGAVAALVRNAADTRIRSEDDLAQVTTAPLLASTDTPPRADGRRQLVLDTAPTTRTAEDYRALRTSVQFVSGRSGSLTLFVTSAHAGEGKSTVAANLALALAEAGSRVVLVDADLRRPTVAATFDVEGAAGLTSVLIGQATVTDVLQPWGGGNLSLLCSGVVPPNPVELLSSPVMQEVLAELGADFDAVVVDTAPIIPVTDAVVLAGGGGHVLVVGNSGRLRQKQLREAVGRLERVDARVVGVVLTHLRKRGGEDLYGYASQPTGASVRPVRAPSAPTVEPGWPVDAQPTTGLGWVGPARGDTAPERAEVPADASPVGADEPHEPDLGNGVGEGTPPGVGTGHAQPRPQPSPPVRLGASRRG